MPDYGRRRLLEGGGKCLKYLKKGGWNRKEKRGKEDFIKGCGGQARSRGGCFSKRGDWNSLMNYADIITLIKRILTAVYYLTAAYIYIYTYIYIYIGFPAGVENTRGLS